MATLGFTYGAAAGSTPPAAGIQADSRDEGFLITCGTGSATTTGTYGTVTFAGNYSATAVDDPPLPKITLTAAGPFAPAAQFYVATIATNGFTIGSVNVPTASKAAGMGGFGVIIVHVDFLWSASRGACTRKAPAALATSWRGCRGGGRRGSSRYSGYPSPPTRIS